MGRHQPGTSAMGQATCRREYACSLEVWGVRSGFGFEVQGSGFRCKTVSCGCALGVHLLGRGPHAMIRAASGQVSCPHGCCRRAVRMMPPPGRIAVCMPHLHLQLECGMSQLTTNDDCALRRGPLPQPQPGSAAVLLDAGCLTVSEHLLHHL